MRKCPIMNDYLADDECAETILALDVDCVIAWCRNCAPASDAPVDAYLEARKSYASTPAYQAALDEAVAALEAVAAPAGPDLLLPDALGKEIVRGLKRRGLSMADASRQMGLPYKLVYKAIRGLAPANPGVRAALADMLRSIGEEALGRKIVGNGR